MSGFETLGEQPPIPLELQLQNQDVKYIDSASDLPALTLAPDDNMRSKLLENTKYVVTSSFVWPLIWMPKGPVAPVFSVTVIEAGRLGISILVDGDDTPQFWGRNISVLSFRSILIVDVGNAGSGRSSKLFDLTGSVGFSFCSGEFTQIAGFKNAGSFVNLPLQLIQSAVSANESGFVLRSESSFSVNHIFSTVLFDQPPASDAMVKPMLAIQGSPRSFGMDHGSVRLGSGDAFLCIEATAAGNYDVIGTAYQGASEGTFFCPDPAASLTAMANVDIAISAFSDSAEDPGVDTTATVSAYTGLTIGQTILIGDAGAPYDGTHVITRVADNERSFDFATTFTSTTTGNVKLTRVTTSAANTIVENQQLTITGTTSYNETVKTVFATNTTFDIPVAFVADDATGSAASGSRNETGLGINLLANGAQKDSKSIGGAIVVDNSAVTTITTQNVWVDLNLSSAVVSSNAERWDLENATTGQIEYLDNKPFFGIVMFHSSGASAGSSESFQFRVVKNGSPLSDGVISEKGLTSTVGTASLAAPINNAVQNDKFRIQVRNIDGTSNVTIEQMSMIIQ